MAAEIKENREQRVVVGLGFTGLSCARYLYQRGLHFSVIDTRAEPPALNELRDEMPDIEVFTGDYPPDVVSSAVELIVSPGIAIDAPIVLQAQAVGTDVVGDIDLFMREAAAPVIGITGSNAKSTVTELLGRMARDAKLSVGVGGNLGTPALDLLSSERDLYVLELSSFQLERSGRLGLTVAAVLNVSADHMDRHRTMSVYQQAKHRIFRGCKTAVINRDDLLTIPTLSTGVEVVSWRMEEPESNGFGLRNEEGSEHLCFGSEALLAVSELRLVGRHNVANALAALALGHAAGLPLDSMRASLRTFVGLTIDEVLFIDDSKGTNVGATVAAIEGFGSKSSANLILIAGGQGKGQNFNDLRSAASRFVKYGIFYGQDAACVAVLSVYSLAEAVNAAASKAEAGDVVLLSPACASFDMFTGYGERGDTFRRLVNSLAGAVNG